MKLMPHVIYIILTAIAVGFLTHSLLKLSGKPVTGSEYERVMDRINNTQ